MPRSVGAATAAQYAAPLIVIAKEFLGHDDAADVAALPLLQLLRREEVVPLPHEGLHRTRMHSAVVILAVIVACCRSCCGATTCMPRCANSNT
jgi:hypothetical protein